MVLSSLILTRFQRDTTKNGSFPPNLPSLKHLTYANQYKEVIAQQAFSAAEARSFIAPRR
jgi:hypothetical protein